MPRLDELNVGVAPPRPSFSLGTALVCLGFLLYGCAPLYFGPDSALSAFGPRPLFELAAAFLICGGGFLSAAYLAHAKERASHRPLDVAPDPHAVLSMLPRKLGDALMGAHELALRIKWHDDWFAILATPVASVAGLVALLNAWRSSPPEPSNTNSLFVPAALVVAAFPMLVLERHWTHLPEKVVSEAPRLAQLCRVPVLALLVLAGASGARAADFGDASTVIERCLAIALAMVALELTLRSLIHFFMPLPPLSIRRSQSASVIAEMIRFKWPDFKPMTESVSRQFGIDLARSWALQFIRRAVLPLSIGTALFAWLLSGVTALGLNQRAIYEVFGRPLAVFHSGLHCHLPWPIGSLRLVELGTVREIPIIFAADDGPRSEEASTAEPSGVQGMEDAPPASSDRLWDASHPSEASYLIASLSGGQQNFEVVNIDLRILYRIGLSDTAARQAAYNIDSPDAMIRAAAGRMLARHFARYTIRDVLGQNRAEFIHGFQAELQARLTALATGVEIMGIVVEAIHPPAAAASAYQGVRTATIRSVTQISEARAEQARTMGWAEQSASQTRNFALGEAAERINASRTELALFEGDRKAYAMGGPAFLFERRLDRLDTALAGLPLTIVDHRIPKESAPILDLRPQANRNGLD